MAYIIAVNASIVADSGGTCVCATRDSDPLCLADTDYLMCTQQIKRDAVTATAAISSLATFCMGLFANMLVLCIDFSSFSPLFDALPAAFLCHAYFAFSSVELKALCSPVFSLDDFFFSPLLSEVGPPVLTCALSRPVGLAPGMGMFFLLILFP